MACLLGDLMKPALETSGQSRHHDVRQRALFQKTKEVIGVKA